MNYHILIIEDDVLLNKVFKHFLIEAGFEISSLVSGVGVHEIITLQRPDIILLDLVMPDKDGFMVLSELRDDPKVSSIPVIVLSNLSKKSDKERVLKLGAKAMYVKSEHTFPEIIQKISKMLKIS